jgi:hypothetical protein
MRAKRTMRAQQPRRGATALLGVLALAACDLGGPRGPVRVAGTVTGDPALGAAVVELTWQGVKGFEGRGGTQLYSGAVAGSPTRHRLVLVDAAGGDLRFTIDLEDDLLQGPVATVVSAVGTDNLPLDAADLRVVLER